MLWTPDTSILKDGLTFASQVYQIDVHWNFHVVSELMVDQLAAA